jgi:TolA-binding protein
MSAAVAAAPSDAESIRTELEELRSRDAVERETSRQQLASLQEGLAALTSTLEQREQVKREQSEQRLMELRELQGAVAAHNGGKTRSGNLSRQRPSSAGTAGGGSGRRRAAARRPPGRPHSPESSRDLSITVGGRKSKRTVARSTGAVKELGRALHLRCARSLRHVHRLELRHATRLSQGLAQLADAGII